MTATFDHPRTTTLSHTALQQDLPQIRPTLESSVGLGSRALLTVSAAVVGAGAALALSPTVATGLTGAVIGASAITALVSSIEPGLTTIPGVI